MTNPRQIRMALGLIRLPKAKDESADHKPTAFITTHLQ
jgi:hypothetical protein